MKQMNQSKKTVECNSGLEHIELYDRDGNVVARVCKECRQEILIKYRPEPIEEPTNELIQLKAQLDIWKALAISFLIAFVVSLWLSQ